MLGCQIEWHMQIRVHFTCSNLHAFHMFAYERSIAKLFSVMFKTHMGVYATISMGGSEHPLCTSMGIKCSHSISVLQVVVQHPLHCT